MIKIKKLSKSYKDQEVLKDVNLEFKNNGLTFILGPSGCGKTTLINAISGLIDYQGDIIINNINIKTLGDEQISRFRLENIGYVFQDFKLFNNDTVLENVLLPLQCLNLKKKKNNVKRAHDILKLLDIYELKDQYVNQLSGGQRQKVAIARSIINDCKILLCDEPTGCLDQKNKQSTMEILKRISTTRIVIVISHDKDLANKYGDYIYQFENKNLTLIKSKEESEANQNKSLPIIDLKSKSNKSLLPTKFLFSHSKNSIKQRRFRSLIVNLVVSFGFLMIGLSFLLSDTIYSSVIGVYSNIITDNQVVVSAKEYSLNSYDVESITSQEAEQIVKNYSDYIDDYGICYLANFEEYFKDLNILSLANTSYRYVLSGYSIRLINEFIWLEDLEDTVYPYKKEELEDDEIIISLDPFTLSEICYQLRIERTTQSLADYISSNDLNVVFELANSDWAYEDEQIFKIVGFTISNEPTIYHSNHLFNEQVFEEQMRFPINNNISEDEYYPWILKKTYYLRTKTTNEEFLKVALKESSLAAYLFEIGNKDYYPWLYTESNSRDVDRLIVFYNPFTSFNYFDYDKFKFEFNDIHNPIYSTPGGYSIYGTSLLSGFTNMLFMSSSESLLDETTGLFSYYDFDPTAMIELPTGVMWGHYTKTSMDGVFYKTLDNITLSKGVVPDSYTQLVISSGLANKLFGTTDVINKEIYLSMVVDSTNDVVDQTFYVSGIVDNSNNIIYHDELFSILFFQTQLGVSCFNLVPIGMSFDLSNSNDSQVVINKLKTMFPNYDFLNPMYDIKIQTDTMCNYLEIILWVLSILTMIVAVCLVSICNYMHLMDIKKDIGLLRCMGISKNESLKLLFSHSLFVTFMGVICSCIELVFMYFVFSLGAEKILNVSIDLSFSLIPYIFMICFAFIIGIISASFLIKKVKSLNAIECLKIG